MFIPWALLDEVLQCLASVLNVHFIGQCDRPSYSFDRLSFRSDQQAFKIDLRPKEAILSAEVIPEWLKIFIEARYG
jgi:hypothetical protein